MKTETYFHPRFRRMKPVYRAKGVFADHYATKGDSKRKMPRPEKKS